MGEFSAFWKPLAIGGAVNTAGELWGRRRCSEEQSLAERRQAGVGQLHWTLPSGPFSLVTGERSASSFLGPWPVMWSLQSQAVPRP